MSGEESYYRDLYWSIFGKHNEDLISEIWRPKWTTETDPCARLITT
jgi:asparagine synthase (glutamine-hydrolysing)